MTGQNANLEARHAVVVTGPVGAGKSTVAAALSDEMIAREWPHALVEMDYLRWAFPRADDDRFGARLGLANLAAIWPNLRAGGVRWVILADVIEHPDSASQYIQAMPGVDVTVVRLHVPMDLIEQRLNARETGDSLAWCLQRAPELQEIMEREGVGDMVIDVGERSPAEVAAEIAGRLEVATVTNRVAPLREPRRRSVPS